MNMLCDIFLWVFDATIGASHQENLSSPNKRSASPRALADCVNTASVPFSP
ncbi:hypothetical protein [Brevibacillus antibioticus]|uniref:hypothetical protein n=1 Tax=Brevibacillus antibioticus TaxID=2570228 RepID=UPI001FCB524B|nr:hypothetical protein [Brevibacillus antibioticus]